MDHQGSQVQQVHQDLKAYLELLEIQDLLELLDHLVSP